MPGGSEQIFSVFAVALATSIINSVLFSAAPAPAEEEFHWCYTDSSCNEEAWKQHFPVSNLLSESEYSDRCMYLMYHFRFAMASDSPQLTSTLPAPLPPASIPMGVLSHSAAMTRSGWACSPTQSSTTPGESKVSRTTT